MFTHQDGEDHRSSNDPPDGCIGVDVPAPTEGRAARDGQEQGAGLPNHISFPEVDLCTEAPQSVWPESWQLLEPACPGPLGSTTMPLG